MKNPQGVVHPQGYSKVINDNSFCYTLFTHHRNNGTKLFSPYDNSKQKVTILQKIFFSLPLRKLIFDIMKKTTQPKPKVSNQSKPKLKTSARLVKDVTTVSKSGDTTRTKYPAQYGKGTKSQLTKVETFYRTKK